MEDRKLFVGMLPRTFTDADVRDLFTGLGTIDECTVLRESDGTSKGVLATRWNVKALATDFALMIS